MMFDACLKKKKLKEKQFVKCYMTINQHSLSAEIYNTVTFLRKKVTSINLSASMLKLIWVPDTIV